MLFAASVHFHNANEVLYSGTLLPIPARLPATVVLCWTHVGAPGPVSCLECPDLVPEDLDEGVVCHKNLFYLFYKAVPFFASTRIYTLFPMEL